MAVFAAVDTSFLLSAAAGRQSSKSGARPRPGKRASSFSTSFLRAHPAVRQLSTKACRNCSNISVAQVVAASWSNSSPAFEAPDPRSPRTPPSPPTSQRMTSQSRPVESPFPLAGEAKASAAVAKAAASLSSDGSFAVHAEIGLFSPQIREISPNYIRLFARPTKCSYWDLRLLHALLQRHCCHGPIGERFGRGINTDAITTPAVNTSACWFNNSDELIDFKEKRHASFEYSRYGNPTTQALEEKMSALERTESTLFVSSGMRASVAMLLALVPAGGHIVTTTDCYRKTRILIQNELPKMGISVTIIDPADI